MRDSQPKGWDFKFVGCVAFKDSHAHLANAYERLNRATTILVEAMYAHYDKMPIDEAQPRQVVIGGLEAINAYAILALQSAVSNTIGACTRTQQSGESGSGISVEESARAYLRALRWIGNVMESTPTMGEATAKSIALVESCCIELLDRLANMLAAETRVMRDGQRHVERVLLSGGKSSVRCACTDSCYQRLQATLRSSDIGFSLARGRALALLREDKRI
jgi:hypothetical protein